MTLKTLPWDSAAYLETDEDMADYLDVVLEENDPALVIYALGVIARARGISQLAREIGMERETLHQALSSEGHPEFATVLKVIKALGLRLRAQITKATEAA